MTYILVMFFHFILMDLQFIFNIIVKRKRNQARYRPPPHLPIGRQNLSLPDRGDRRNFLQLPFPKPKDVRVLADPEVETTSLGSADAGTLLRQLMVGAHVCVA